MKEKTLVILDPTLKKGFTSVPNKVLFAPVLSMAAKCLYAILLAYAWQEDECFPGQERLAKAAGCTDRTVRKYLDELKQLGLVSWIQRGLNQTNIYYIHDTAQIEQLNPLGDKDRKALSGPDRKGRSGQDRKELSDIRILSSTNVVVDEAPVEKNRKPQQSFQSKVSENQKVKVHESENATTLLQLQRQAEKMCGVRLTLDLLGEVVEKFGEEQVNEKINMLGSVQTRNAPGFLIAALRDDYIFASGQPRQQQQKRILFGGQAIRKNTQTRAREPDTAEAQERKELIKSFYLS
ncbi:helix-turn-helix domain-containing protein [Desulfoscipio gibsoniae]